MEQFKRMVIAYIQGAYPESGVMVVDDKVLVRLDPNGELVEWANIITHAFWQEDGDSGQYLLFDRYSMTRCGYGYDSTDLTVVMLRNVPDFENEPTHPDNIVAEDEEIEHMEQQWADRDAAMEQDELESLYEREPTLQMILSTALRA